MLKKAANAGTHTCLVKDYPHLKIRTTQALLDNKGFETPSEEQILDWTTQCGLPM
jgi:hypothetical protein